MSVQGPLPAERLGMVLPHEHLFVQQNRWFAEPENEEEKEFSELPVSLGMLADLRYRPFSNLDNLRIDDYSTVNTEVRRFARVGGGTIVDLTLRGIGRNPVQMQRVSKDTGVNVVCGCGYYLERAHPPEVANMNVDEISDSIVKELLEGIDEFGIRPGVIGEIGTSHPVTEAERKVLRGAAHAQTRTGAPISVHLSAGPLADWLEILDILEVAGANLEKVALGHVDGHRPLDVEGHAELGRRGVYVEYDLFGVMDFTPDRDADPDEWGYWPQFPSDLERIDALKVLWDLGIGDRLLLSHDVCLKMQQVAYGGYGFSHLPGSVLPVMRLMGFSNEQTDRMFILNPASWLTWASS
jgi:phosphotriesterase-related protein